MKKVLSYIACWGMLINVVFAQSTKKEHKVFYDGPYVLYRNEDCIIYSIDSSAANPVSIGSFDIHKKMQHPVQVHFPGKSGWDFSVPFHKSLSTEPCVFPAAGKIFAISDIEGEFKNFRAILIANGIMDAQSRWTFGEGHLVICGDLFDRGKDVAPELWLIYKLEAEARAKGGYVHTILGDHEIMNLSGDLRYVRSKYKTSAKVLGMDYMDFYSPATELGRWLRTKNIIEKIGDNLFLHGGLSPEVNKRGLSLQEINTLCRPYFDKSQNKALLDAKNVRLYFDGRKGSQTAPFWYRGYFADKDPATMAQVDASLRLYNCHHIIVGHTIVAHVQLLYNGKVIALDVNEHKDHTEAVLIDNGVCYKAAKNGARILM